MSIAKNNTVTKLAAIAIGLAMVFSFAAPQAQAQSVEDLTAQINSLLATIASLQSQLASMQGGDTSGGSTASVCPYTWTSNLTTGSQGPDVLALQKFLNSDPTTQVSSTGAGSPGNETDYFGPRTAAAVTAFQNQYASEVLAPVGLSAGTGYFGPSSRAKANELCVAAPVTPPTDGGDDGSDDGDDDAPAGTGVTVSAGSQPSNSIAPNLASRVPFTRFSLTAGADGPVTINNVTVERTGFADNNVFSGVLLLGPDGNVLGDSKTLNSNNQARVGTTYTIPAGQTHTFTVAGNRANSSGKDGQVASLSVVAINTSATVSGSLPITGASHVINESLSIGTAQVDVGPTDQNSAQTEEVGVTNELFAAVRITNTSSDEDMRLQAIRFQQVGSVSNSDIANVRILIDGVEYPVTVSGDYYSADLGSGVVIAEGFNKEVIVRGDIVGGSNRTIQFDVEEPTDIYLVGETYGFGITPTAGSTSGASTGAEMTTSGTPFFDGSQFTISSGTFTTWSKSNTVPAQNIAINVPNQPLGSFEADIKGEAISVQNMTFNFTIAGGANGSDLTNVSLVDSNGVVIAGPSDGSGSGTSGSVTFSDTVTLPVGKSTYTLRGKLSTDFGNDDTIIASSSPSADWSGIEGEETGDNISPLPGIATGNTVTVKAASVVARVASSPTSQSVVAGVSGMHIASVVLDGTQSGENVRFTSLQLRYTQSSGTGDPTNCRLYDGNTILTDDSVNPTSAGAYTFTLDSNIVVAKGTAKTLDVKCDVPGSVTNGDAFAFGINTADTITGTGVDSGTSVNAMTGASNTTGPVMTVAGSGTILVELDPSSPSYALAAAGTSNVTLAVLRVAGTNEDINLQRVGLQLSGSASSTPSDLQSVGIYHDGVQVGTALFTGSLRFATSTLTQTVTIPKNDEIQLTLKGTLSQIGSSQPGTQGALVQVDFDADDPTATRGIGQASGSTINHGSSADTNAAGVRMFRTYPTFAKVAVPSNNLVTGDNTLYRFSVTADSQRQLGIYKFTLNMATTTASVATANVFGYTDSGFSTPISGVRPDGALRQSDAAPDANGDLEVIIQNGSGSTQPLQVPAGATRYFEVRGSVTGATNGTVATKLLGDQAYPSLATLMANAVGVDADTNDDFIWSPNATTTSSINHADWTNGFGIVGLPGSNMTQEVLEDN